MMKGNKYLILLGLLAALPLCAQNAEITGTVADQSGAVIAGAKVTVTNTATNTVREVETGETGNFTVPFLTPGIYNVRSELEGFSTATRTGVELQVGATARINFAMEIGNITEQIEVVASGEMLQTEGTAVGTVIENKRIVELPLNGRNYLQLVALSPNVTAEQRPAFTATGRQGGERAQQAFSVAGQRNAFIHYTLDGIENTDPNWNLFVFRPSIDALQEFKIESGVYSAEYGRNPGQINATTKSDTNELHGTLFEFLRNNVLDAREWNQAYEQRNPFRRNQFGATVTGPIVKDKLFFMANYEGLRDVKTLQQLSSVATDRMRSGDFGAAGRSIFDHATRTFTTDADGNPIATSALPYANNVIPENRWHPVTQKLIEQYPRATRPGDDFINNYSRGAKRPLKWDQINTRIDWNESINSFWFGRFGFNTEDTTTACDFPNQCQNYLTDAYQGMLANTRTFSPTIVNELRFGYTQLWNESLSEFAYERDITTEAGIVDSRITVPPPAWGTPSVGMGNGISGFGDPVDAPFVDHNHIFQLIDNLSIIRGNHSFKFGGEIRRERINEDGNIYNRGNISFGDAFATQNPLSPAGTGFGFADYMLGKPSNFNWAGDLSRTLLRATAWVLYLEDTWKVTPKLTMNAGLRYERTPPYTDKYRGVFNMWFHDFGALDNSTLDPNSQHPVLLRQGEGDFYEGTAARFVDSNPTATGSRIESEFGLPQSLIMVDKNDFAPRLGLAYSMGDKTTIRAGIGVFYNQDVVNASQHSMGQNPAGRANVLTNAQTIDLDIANPLATYAGDGVCTGWDGICQGAASRLYLVSPTRRTPYTIQYLLNIQHQLTDSTLVELGYQGNNAHKLQFFANKNMPILRSGPGDGRSAVERRPWTDIGAMQFIDGVGNSNYNAFAAKVTQRFSGGLTYLGAFTWSKTIDGPGSGLRTALTNNSPMQYYNYDASVGLAEFHTGRRFVTSLVYELPIARNSTGFVRAIAAGWQLGSIFTLVDGTPANVGSIGDRAQIELGSAPDATGVSPFLENPTADRFWNRDAFNWTNPELEYRYGNVGRSTLFTPGTFQWDFSMIKNTRISERQNLEFRFEAFNFPNHANWNIPFRDVRQSNFGRVTTAKTMREMQFGLKYSF
jgi:Carboxypeptidase regulatory-like domain